MANQSRFIRPSRQIEQNARPVHAVMKRSRLGRTGYKVTHVSLGTYRFTGDFGIPRSKAVDLLGRRKLDVTPLLSHGSDFFDLVRGFEAALAPDTLKVVVDYP